MSAFWAMWNVTITYDVYVVAIVTVVAVVIAAAMSRSLLGHWLGLRVGAPRRGCDCSWAERLGCACDWSKRDEQLARRLKADAERLYPGMPHLGMNDGMAWPDDLCSWPPCEFEDNHLCTWHAQQLRGKHHPPPLTYDAEPIVATITDLPEPSDPRWSR